MYLFLLLLAACSSAVVNTITGHFADSIFKSMHKFWHPYEEMGWNAVTVFSFGKLLFLLLAAVVAQFRWWQISFEKIEWHFQLLIALATYSLTVIVLLEFILTTKKSGIHETIK